jgi:hypothetical protein
VRRTCDTNDTEVDGGRHRGDTEKTYGGDRRFTLSYDEAIMTVQFSRQTIAALSANLPMTGSGLVRRLVRARDDPGKERIRMWLIDLDDAQLQSGLGLTVEDIAVLRTGTKTASPLR